MRSPGLQRRLRRAPPLAPAVPRGRLEDLALCRAEVNAQRTHAEALAWHYALGFLSVRHHGPRLVGEIPHHHPAGPPGMRLDSCACCSVIAVPVEVVAG